MTETEFASGNLSFTCRYRLFISGEFDVREIENLIKILELHKTFMTTSDYDPKHVSAIDQILK